MAESIGWELWLRRMQVASIAAATAITILDGFDAFSLSLMAPQIGASLQIPTASLGMVFASVMVGMILGGVVGGASADRFGHLRILYVALALFGAAALALPLVSDSGVEVIAINRLISGIGLGAAAPIAVGLLNRTLKKPPSELVIALVWSGIPIGGTLAALYKYMFLVGGEWRPIFVTGGLLPIPIAMFARYIFGGVRTSRKVAGAARPKIIELFDRTRTLVTLAIAAMFFFGYVTTSIIVNWLPTILTHRAASSFIIFVTFGAINAGSVLGMLALGFVASRYHVRYLLAWTWAAAGVCGLAAGIAGFGTASVALLAIGAYTIGAGAQALSVALANDLYKEQGRETTAIGFMTGNGRLGQACALGASGAVISFSGQETLVFELAGVCACIAALLALVAVHSRIRISLVE